MNNHAKSTDSEANRFGIWLLVVMALGLIILAVIGNLAIDKLEGQISTYSTLITLAFALVGIGGITILLIGLAIVLAVVKLSDHPYALGLPQGSIRAVLALSLVVIFICTSIYLVGLMDLEQAGEARVDLAKQIFTTVATVLVTVIGFYFGSRSTASSPEEGAAHVLATGERMASDTKLAAQIDEATKIVTEIEKSAKRADAAKAGAKSNVDEAKGQTRSAMDAERGRVEKAGAEASSALARARELLKEMKAARQAAAAGGADKASAESAAETFAKAMTELANLAGLAANAAAKAEKIVSRGRALQQKPG